MSAEPRKEALSTLANTGPRFGTTTAPRGEHRPTGSSSGTTKKLITRPITLALDIPKGDKQIVSDLKEARQMCSIASNVIQRDMWTHDAAALDAWMQAHGRQPKMGRGGEWKFPANAKSGYKMAGKAVPKLASGIRSALARSVEKKWYQERFEALILEDRRPPHYRRDMAIPLRAQDVKLIPTKDGYSLRFSVFSGYGNAMTIPLVVKDDWQRSVLDSLGWGEELEKDASKWKLGGVKIVQDRIHFRKWYAKISYTREVAPSKGKLYGAINRGLFRFMVGVMETGRLGLYDVMYFDGNDAASYLGQMQSRRKEYQYASGASGRRGHGRQRVLRPTDKLSGKASRYKNTSNQNKAKAFAEKAASLGVGHVFIEDFTGIRDGEPERLKVRKSAKGKKWIWDRIQEWPFYDLEQRIIACLEERGISHTPVSAHYISQTCPVCGAESEKSMQLGKRMFQCVSCGWKRDLDVVAAVNVMHRGFEKLSADAANPTKNQVVSSGRRRVRRTARKRRSK